MRGCDLCCKEIYGTESFPTYAWGAIEVSKELDRGRGSWDQQVDMMEGERTDDGNKTRREDRVGLNGARMRHLNDWDSAAIHPGLNLNFWRCWSRIGDWHTDRVWTWRKRCYTSYSRTAHVQNKSLSRVGKQGLGVDSVDGCAECRDRQRPRRSRTRSKSTAFTHTAREHVA